MKAELLQAVFVFFLLSDKIFGSYYGGGRIYLYFQPPKEAGVP